MHMQVKSIIKEIGKNARFMNFVPTNYCMAGCSLKYVRRKVIVSSAKPLLILKSEHNSRYKTR